MTTLSTSSYLKTFWELIKTDFIIFRKNIIGKLIDSACWVSVILLSNTYVLPLLGITNAYGQYVAIGTVVTLSFFNIFEFSSQFLADLEGNRTITSSLILPIPTWLVFLKLGVFYALEVTILSLPLIPFAKLLLMHRLDLSAMCLPKIAFAFLSIHCCNAAFALFITSTVKSMEQIMQVFNRALFPMWTFGGSLFSWKTLAAVWPSLAYVNLLNPIVHSSECLRHAFLGGADYLPFWPSCAALWLITLILGTIGIAVFKKRLDFV